MSMETPRGREFFPEESLAIAGAITERSIRSGNENDQIMAHLNGTPFAKVSNEAQRASKLYRTALMLKRIEDPNFAANTAQYINLTLSGKEAEELAAHFTDASSSDHIINEEDIRKVFIDLASQTNKRSEYSTDERAEDFAALLKAATEVADENNISVADVYENDDFYYEASRRATTLENFAKKHIAVMDMLSAEILRSVLINFLEDGIRKELEELPSDMIESYFLDLQLDDELNASIDSAIELSREATRQLFVHRALQRWGPEVIEQLYTDDFTSLLPLLPYTPLVQATVDRVSQLD